MSNAFNAPVLAGLILTMLAAGSAKADDKAVDAVSQRGAFGGGYQVNTVGLSPGGTKTYNFSNLPSNWTFSVTPISCTRKGIYQAKSSAKTGKGARHAGGAAGQGGKGRGATASGQGGRGAGGSGQGGRGGAGGRH